MTPRFPPSSSFLVQAHTTEPLHPFAQPLRPSSCLGGPRAVRPTSRDPGSRTVQPRIVPCGTAPPAAGPLSGRSGRRGARTARSPRTTASADCSLKNTPVGSLAVAERLGRSRSVRRGRSRSPGSRTPAPRAARCRSPPRPGRAAPCTPQVVANHLVRLPAEELARSARPSAFNFARACPLPITTSLPAELACRRPPPGRTACTGRAPRRRGRSPPAATGGV